MSRSFCRTMRTIFWRACAWLLVAAPAVASAQEPPTIHVGSKAFTESHILGEALVALIQSTGAKTTHKSEMGTRVVFEALKKGDIDLYPEYTGTITAELFAGQSLRTDEDIRAALRELGLGMTERLGFNNTYALGIKRTEAEARKLAKISDLARDDEAIRKLRFGLSDEFLNRNDGWPGLKNTYRLPHTPLGMNHNLAYQGIERGSLDVTDLYSTDAEIRSYDLTVLDDDQGYFPVYHCVILYRLDVFERQPRVADVVRLLEGKIDNPTMVEMNARARVDRVPAAQVAANFVRERLQIDVPLPPSDAFQRITSNLVRTTVQHLAMVLAALFAGVVIAVPLGVLSAKFQRLGPLILGGAGIVQTVPALAMLVFLIPILDLGMKPAIFALVLYSLLPIIAGTHAGLTGITANLRESALVLGLPSFARLRLVELPLAMPSILSGIRTAAVICVGTATIGGFVGAGGYGQTIITGLRLMDYSLLMQGAIPAALMALAASGVCDVLERWLIPAGLRVQRA